MVVKSGRLLTKLNKNPVAVQASITPSARPSNRLIDLHAMDYAKKTLEMRGYRDVISLTNASNQGIDLVARKTLANGKDVWVHFEVKGHWQAGPPKLSIAQSQRNAFVESRLRTMDGNLNGRWSPSKIDPSILKAAREALDDINAGKKIHGAVLNVDYATSLHPGPRGSVWYWPRQGGAPFQIGNQFNG